MGALEDFSSTRRMAAGFIVPESMKFTRILLVRRVGWAVPATTSVDVALRFATNFRLDLERGG